MSDHSKTEERLRSEEERSVEQPSTSEPKEQQDSLEPSTSDEQQESTEPNTSKATKREAQAEEDGSIERLKRYRKEIAHSIRIPDTWEKESQLKDWTGSPSALERSLVPEGLSSARQALVVACRQAR